MSIDEAWRFTLATPAGAKLRPATRKRFEETLSRFDRYVHAVQGIHEVEWVDSSTVEAFIKAVLPSGCPPAPSTQRTRLSAIRFLYRALRDLGLTSVDPTVGLSTEAGSAAVIRPLTDAEVGRCREAAGRAVVATRYVAIWALAEAGASTSDTAMVSRRDFEIERGVVRLSGGPKGYPRVISLTTWAIQCLQAVERGSDESEWLPVLNGRDHDSARTSVSAALAEIMHRAGVRDEGVEARSVTAWAGRSVMATTGRIDTVAHVLGMKSLDRAAALIGLDWRSAAVHMGSASAETEECADGYEQDSVSGGYRGDHVGG